MEINNSFKFTTQTDVMSKKGSNMLKQLFKQLNLSTDMSQTQRVKLNLLEEIKLVSSRMF